MTVIGKILVFFNLVASILTASLIAMAYTTRTNWATGYSNASASYKAAVAATAAEVELAKTEVRGKEAEFRKAVGEKEAAVKAVEAERDTLKTQLEEIKTVKAEALPKAIAINQNLTQEVERRKVEIDGFITRLKDRDDKLVKMDNQLTVERDRATKNQQLFEAANERNRLFREQTEALKIENSQLRAQVGAGSSATTAKGEKVLPPEDVRGTIQRIDGEFATISIGSDAGVNVGNTLQVYRLNPPDFLGKIEIVAATPQKAVGRLTGPKKNQIRVNDEVAANILGK